MYIFRTILAILQYINSFKDHPFHQMAQPLLFSPSQLAYLHTSLSLRPPIRPDARTPTTFRSLYAETDFLPAANGSARVCFAEGGEAVVGIRAEVEQTVVRRRWEQQGRGGEGEGEGEEEGEDSWVEVAIEQREDEAEGVFLAETLREGLLADGNLRGRLAIGRRWHWRIFVDVRFLTFFLDAHFQFQRLPSQTLCASPAHVAKKK